MEEYEVGSWVATSKPGIWQVYRKESFMTLDPVTEHEVQRTIYFVKRFLNGSLKRSFGEACFSGEYLTAFDSSAVQELQEYIIENPDLYTKFQVYEPKDISNIYNVKVNLPEDISAKDIETLISNDQELTETDIAQLVRRLGLEADKFPTFTLQFESRNFKCRENQLIYNFVRISKF